MNEEPGRHQPSTPVPASRSAPVEPTDSGMPDAAAPSGGSGGDAPVPEEIATLLRDWHQAVNTKNLEAVVNLSTADVRVRGPRGSGSGHELLRTWLTRSGIQLELKQLRSFGRGVLAEQTATWPASADSPAKGPTDCVTVFAVRDGKVSAVLRYATEAEAASDVDAATGTAPGTAATSANDGGPVTDGASEG